MARPRSEGPGRDRKDEKGLHVCTRPAEPLVTGRAEVIAVASEWFAVQDADVIAVLQHNYDPPVADGAARHLALAFAWDEPDADLADVRIEFVPPRHRPRRWWALTQSQQEEIHHHDGSMTLELADAGPLYESVAAQPHPA